MDKQKEIERLKALTYTDIYYEMESLKNTITELNRALKLQQTGVMRSACKHDEENDTKAYAKNGNEFIGYYCEKCDTVYCGSI